MNNITEAGLGDSALVDKGVQKSNGLAKFLPETGYERGPERCYRAGSADGRAGAFAANLITGCRIGITGDVGHSAATACSGGLRRNGNGGLIGWQWEKLADTTSGALADLVARRWVGNDRIPDCLARDGASGNEQVRAAAPKSMGCRSRKVDCQSRGSVE